MLLEVKEMSYAELPSIRNVARGEKKLTFRNIEGKSNLNKLGIVTERLFV